MLEKYQYANVIKRLNRWVQILLAITLVGMVNLLAIHVYERADLSGGNLYTLSAESLAYIEELSGTIQLIHSTIADSPHEDERILHRYVSSLLKEYQFASRGNRPGARIVVEHVDIYKNLARAQELARQHNFDQPHSLLVLTTNPDGSERRRIITPDAILEFQEEEPVAFKGEQAVTSALLEVMTDRHPRVYFTRGHGELRLNDTSPARGLSRLAEELSARNIELRTLELAEVNAVPADADLIVIADPQGPMMPQDVEKLRAYLTNESGRIILFLSPAVRHGLEPLLSDWGILADDKLVLEQSSDYIEGAGNYLLRQFAEHPITQVLIDNHTPVITGLNRPARQDPGRPIDERLRVTELIATSPSSWAETSYRDPGLPTYNSASDLPGPVTVATVAERRASSQLGIEVPGGRLIVFGSGDLFTNRRITTIGNFRLFFNSLNWSLDRDQLLAIPPRPIERYQIVASHGQLQRIGLLFLAVPGAVALAGIFITWFRRL